MDATTRSKRPRIRQYQDYGAQVSPRHEDRPRARTRSPGYGEDHCVDFRLCCCSRSGRAASTWAPVARNPPRFDRLVLQVCMRWCGTCGQAGPKDSMRTTGSPAASEASRSTLRDDREVVIAVGVVDDLAHGARRARVGRGRSSAAPASAPAGRCRSTRTRPSRRRARRPSRWRSSPGARAGRSARRWRRRGRASASDRSRAASWTRWNMALRTIR